MIARLILSYLVFIVLSSCKGDGEEINPGEGGFTFDGKYYELHEGYLESEENSPTMEVLFVSEGINVLGSSLSNDWGKGNMISFGVRVYLDDDGQLM